MYHIPPPTSNVEIHSLPYYSVKFMLNALSRIELKSYTPDSRPLSRSMPWRRTFTGTEPLSPEHNSLSPRAHTKTNVFSTSFPKRALPFWEIMNIIHIILREERTCPGYASSSFLAMYRESLWDLSQGICRIYKWESRTPVLPVKYM